jgi:hypothetical protein
MQDVGSVAAAALATHNKQEKKDSNYSLKVNKIVEKSVKLGGSGSNNKNNNNNNNNKDSSSNKKG